MAVSGYIGPDNAFYVPVKPLVALPVAEELSPVQRVLATDELVSAVGAALIDTYTTIHSHYPPGTAKQMLQFALTCRAWFDTGMTWLWRNFRRLPILIDMLISDDRCGSMTYRSVQYRFVRFLVNIMNPPLTLC